jgi:hypothetical protein
MSKPKYEIGDKVEVIDEYGPTKHGEQTYGFKTDRSVDGEWCYESDIIRRVR